MMISEYIANNRSDYDWDESGNLVVDIPTGWLRAVYEPAWDMDGYGWQDLIYLDMADTANWQAEAPGGTVLDNVSLEFDTDWQAVRADYMTVCDDHMMRTVPSILSVERVETDCESSRLVIDVAGMTGHGADIDVDELREWALLPENYGHSSGFHSFVPARFDSEPSLMNVWAFLVKTLDDEGFDAWDQVIENEFDTMLDHTEVTVGVDSLREAYCEIMGEDEAPDSIVDMTTLEEAMSR